MQHRKIRCWRFRRRVGESGGRGESQPVLPRVGFAVMVAAVAATGIWLGLGERCRSQKVPSSGTAHCTVLGTCQVVLASTRAFVAVRPSTTGQESDKYDGEGITDFEMQTRGKKRGPSITRPGTVANVPRFSAIQGCGQNRR